MLGLIGHLYHTHTPPPKDKGSFGRRDGKIVQARGGARLKYKSVFRTQQGSYAYEIYNN